MTRAEIIDEDDRGIGVRVRDNNEVNHTVAVGFDAEVQGHSQDGYPDDPRERTPAGNEHVEQARRYAKWHVYRERGYETLPRYENPDCIVGAMLALAAAPPATVDDLFGELLDRLRTHAAGGDVQLPFDDADQSEIVVYRQDIYVEPDPLGQDPPLAEQFADFFSDPATTVEKLLGENADSLQGLGDLIEGEAEPAQTLPEFEVDAVSHLHYLHSDGLSEQTHWSDSPRERAPDARVELLPVNPDIFESPHQFLISHLGNQVRDCYLLMGCDPPTTVQQVGLGTYDGMKKQRLLDMYDEHFLADAADESWHQER